MKVHYINILLFALPLNILVYNQRNHKSTTHHTPKISITRLLCECELYAPANYDDDPQMKEVMQQFEDRTTQRFHEYDDRMKTTRQKCKERCDKEIQKIILKDKLEKELMDKFATLQTDIQSDAIPTCVCEKSIEDKVEKGCLRCGSVFGGIAPSVGILGGIGAVAVTAWKPAALKIAIEKALELNGANILAAAKKAGDAVGAAEVIGLIKKTLDIEELGFRTLESIINTNTYTNATLISGSIHAEYNASECGFSILLPYSKKKPFCILFEKKMTAASPGQGVSPTTFIDKTAETIVSQAEGAAKAAEAAENTRITAVITKKQTAFIEAGFDSCITSIYVSIIAIVVIVLIMVIIYLILRYRRKKKMKKKLQYIKLLEE
ncbi:rifin PIR protein, putative [Plasmodium reichenowi]|uniref:Rifin PIR protein, putative n=1 Tax=Plasmodium reichenowi TaxID=5854 RepID=A0A2P9DKS7_PLARE|nr:rifin PIR protein, putative [Plasmodium reichenowi]